jgi:hypothetical protein
VIDVFFGLFCLIGLVYLIFVRVREKGKEKFEKRKW